MAWNEHIPQRFSDVIFLLMSDVDAVETVKLTRSRGLRIAVRAGGVSARLPVLAISHRQ